MSIHHLRLLIEKTARYAWRQRSCRYVPTIVFEFSIPILSILFLCLFRWIYSPSTTNNHAFQIVPEQESVLILNYTSAYRCPGRSIPIEIHSNETFQHLQQICPRSQFHFRSSSSSKQLLIESNNELSYSCQSYNRHWCNVFPRYQSPLDIRHECSQIIDQQFHRLFKTYLATESLLYRPIKRQYLSIFTWPCASYNSDPMFSIYANFSLIILFITIDISIIFNYHFLYHQLIKEKMQKITELLRLLSIHPIFNTLSWFLRHFLIQTIINLFIIIVLKLSFQGAIYFANISIWFLILTFLLWTIQVLSQSILIGQISSSFTIASLCSWLIYFISFWLASSSSIHLGFLLQLICSFCLPFYSIKRLLVLFVQINSNQRQQKDFYLELVLIWMSMCLGSLVIWLITFYFKRTSNHHHHRRRKTSMICEPLINDQIQVRVENLTKTYGRSSVDRQAVLDDISFELKTSTIYGLIGPNGSGKTTTMEILCNLLSYDRGQVDIRSKSIGYCPQTDILFSFLTVQEQLEFYASVRSNSKNIDRQQLNDLLHMVDMYQYKDQLCGTLSGGMKRKISILCAFIGNVDLVILDEPSSSLDPIARRILWTWFRESKYNRTLLISSHLLDEIEELCESVLILDCGHIRAQGTILELKTHFNPSGDRFYLESIPSYIPTEWRLDQHSIQIPDRKQLLNYLNRFEQDQIEYSLNNPTLDEIYLQLASSTEDPSKIEQLFSIRTNPNSYLKQMMAVFIRRCQMLFRQARLLPIVIVLCIIYALLSRYLPTSYPTIEPIRYYISSPFDFIGKANLNNFNIKILPRFSSSDAFQQHLMDLSVHSFQKPLVAIRIPSSTHFECYLLSQPTLTNLMTSCLPIFRLFSNRTISPLKLIIETETTTILTPQDNSRFCHSIAPLSYNIEGVLLSLIFIISSAFAIQDYVSGLHSYSLIHNLSSIIHWSTIFLFDLVLCLIWHFILALISRFIYSSTFTIQYFLLIPIYFIVNLPFIYLLSRFFKSPMLGSFIIIFLIQLAYLIHTFQFFFELFPTSSLLTKLLPWIRWMLILIFPNVNISIFIKATLKKALCPSDVPDEFAYERYENKILIHSLIGIGQFLIYFGLLILIDNWKWNLNLKRKLNEENQDEIDVANERQRIENMTDNERNDQAIILKDLTKYFHKSKRAVVNRLTFAVSNRECFGLLGFNGSGKFLFEVEAKTKQHLFSSGKTTTFRMLVGELQPTRGSIKKNSTTTIGYCPQNDISFSGLTVLQTVNYICRIHGLEPNSINQLLLEQFHLNKYQNYLFSHLSGGTRRRLHLALCLIGSPTLLLLDEPTAQVDSILRHQIRLILQHRPQRTSIIFASHSMFECEQLCDRLTILIQGTARCLGTIEQIKSKYGMTYRIRLRFIESSIDIPELVHIEHTNEYIYKDKSLAQLFALLEQLVDQCVIASDYTVQLTSLEHIFLTLQHSSSAKS